MYLNGQIKGAGIDGKKMPKDINPNATPGTAAKAARAGLYV
jgi:sulfatase modifying factor 1